MRRKGFTLVELLVVIAIVALLMGILMPALARVRQIAHRMVCGTNLSSLGKAMMLYSNDNDEEYPRAGGQKALGVWTADGKIAAWDHLPGGEKAFLDGTTVTASWYSLVKGYDVTTKQFVCRGDAGTRAFKMSDMMSILELEDVWDFGDGSNDIWPGSYCSYSYHMPYNMDSATPGHPIGVVSDSGCPLAADRNPFVDKNADVYIQDSDVTDPSTIWDDPPGSGYNDTEKKWNAAAHQREGQNVLFNDSHVTFERYPNVGIENDNIWLYWGADCDPTGVSPSDSVMQVTSEQPTGDGCCAPCNERDAFLVGEHNRPH